MTELQSTNLKNIQDLLTRVDDREKLEAFAAKSGVSGERIAGLLNTCSTVSSRQKKCCPN